MYISHDAYTKPTFKRENICYKIVYYTLPFRLSQSSNWKVSFYRGKPVFSFKGI